MTYKTFTLKITESLYLLIISGGARWDILLRGAKPLSVEGEERSNYSHNC
jgi:hypothetical protein